MLDLVFYVQGGHSHEHALRRVRYAAPPDLSARTGAAWLAYRIAAP